MFSTLIGGGIRPFDAVFVRRDCPASALPHYSHNRTRCRSPRSSRISRTSSGNFRLKFGWKIGQLIAAKMPFLLRTDPSGEENISAAIVVQDPTMQRRYGVSARDKRRHRCAALAEFSALFRYFCATLMTVHVLPMLRGHLDGGALSVSDCWRGCHVLRVTMKRNLWTAW